MLIKLEIECLKLFKDVYLGERIFILGNGLSLNKVDLNRLKNEYIFVVNKIYFLFDKIDWKLNFYICLDWCVILDSYNIINNLKDMMFFFFNCFYGLLWEGENVFWYYFKLLGYFIYEKFEMDIINGVWGGGIVLVVVI